MDALDSKVVDEPAETVVAVVVVVGQVFKPTELEVQRSLLQSPRPWLPERRLHGPLLLSRERVPRQSSRVRVRLHLRLRLRLRLQSL